MVPPRVSFVSCINGVTSTEAVKPDFAHMTVYLRTLLQSAAVSLGAKISTHHVKTKNPMFIKARNINRGDVATLTGGCVEGILSGGIKILLVLDCGAFTYRQ